MKIKGDSYYRSKRANSLRAAILSMVFILIAYMMTFMYFTLQEEDLSPSFGMISEINDEYIIITREDGLTEYIPRASAGGLYLPGMIPVSYKSGDIRTITLIPFYISVVFIILSACFVVRAVVIISLHRKEKRTMQELLSYGTRYEGKYEETERLKGMRNFRIKVSYENLLTGEKTYYYSTTLHYDPKLFIPGIEKITIYQDSSDPDTYFVDFHGAILSNEAVLMRY